MEKTAISAQPQNIEQIVKQEAGKLKFSTKSVTITGTMDVKIPGRDTYTGVTSFNAVYEQPMNVTVEGNIGKGKGYLDLSEGDVEIISFRQNKEESALAAKVGVIAIVEKVDPEITLYRGKESIILNQVMGIPIVRVGQGKLTYHP